MTHNINTRLIIKYFIIKALLCENNYLRHFIQFITLLMTTDMTWNVDKIQLIRAALKGVKISQNTLMRLLVHRRPSAYLTSTDRFQYSLVHHNLLVINKTFNHRTSITLMRLRINVTRPSSHPTDCRQRS